MTRPRRHIAGQVVAISRRCHSRCFLLRPDDTIDAIVAYAFAMAAQSYGIEIHALVVMSNHIHVIITDVKARRSEFMRDAMSNIAKARNRDLDRSDSFWEGKEYSETVLLDRDAEERKLLYTWLNPPQADLVGRVKEWPGYMILPDDWDKTIKVPKPNVYFGPKTPDEVEFTPRRPPGYEDMSVEELQAYFWELIEEGEARLLQERQREKRRVLGVKRVLATDPFSRPGSRARRSSVRPRFASRNAALLVAAIATYRGFLADYDRQRERWLKGNKRVEFPCGTVWLRRNSPVKCRDPEAPEAGMASMMCVRTTERCRDAESPDAGVVSAM